MTFPFFALQDSIKIVIYYKCRRNLGLTYTLSHHFIISDFTPTAETPFSIETHAGCLVTSVCFVQTFIHIYDRKV